MVKRERNLTMGRTRAKTTVAVTLMLVLTMLAQTVKVAGGRSSENPTACCPQGCTPTCCCAAQSLDRSCTKPAESWNNSSAACRTAPATEATTVFEWKGMPPQRHGVLGITPLEFMPYAFAIYFRNNFSLAPPDPPPRNQLTRFHGHGLRSVCYPQSS